MRWVVVVLKEPNRYGENGYQFRPRNGEVLEGWSVEDHPTVGMISLIAEYRAVETGLGRYEKEFIAANEVSRIHEVGDETP